VGLLHFIIPANAELGKTPRTLSNYRGNASATSEFPTQGIIVANRWFFGIAFDQPLEDGFPPLPFAQQSLEQLANTFSPGVKSSTLVLGSRTTLTVIQSRIRALLSKLRKGDELYLYYSGTGYTVETMPCLQAWDTQPDDLSGTSLPLLTMLKPLASKVKQLVLFLDLQHLKQSETIDLQAVSDAFANLTIISFTTPGEESYVAAKLKARLGAHLLNEALAGKLPNALNSEQQVSAMTLHAALVEALPRLLRRHLESGLTQTPLLFGPDVTIADLSGLLKCQPVGLLDPDRLRRVAFRSESYSKVKELSDFRKSYQVPDTASASSKKFIAKLTTTDIRTDLEDMQLVLREHFGLRRKEAEIQLGSDGTGTLRTPHFDYTVRGSLDADDPSRVHWCRELSQFHEVAFLQSADFKKLFEARFDQLVFEFSLAVDVEAFIDQLEDMPLKGVKLNHAASKDGCEVTLSGHTGRIVLTRNCLVIQGRGGLLDQLLAFLKQFYTLGEPLAIASSKR
jgi:hypothetical protein